MPEFYRVCPECGQRLESEDGEHFFCDNCMVTYTDDEVPIKEERYEDDVPVGCRACGGPYPYCKSSCNIFDD